MPKANLGRELGRVSRAWRFGSGELSAVRNLRPRVGIRRALIERIKWNLELDGVDGETILALVAKVDATEAELVAGRQTTGAELAAAREMLAASMRLTNQIAAHTEIHEGATAHVASPTMIERLLALRYWLAAQPPSSLVVSVIIPTRSRPALLGEAIASVQAQSHSQWELIVVDDGSEDDTRAILAAISDPRVRSVRTDGVGCAAARSAGLKLASGDVIAYLDDDNIMLPGWLAGVAWAFSRFEDVDALYGARVFEDETPWGGDARLPRLAFRQFDRNRLLEGNYIDTSVIAHRAHLPEARWDPAYTGVADWELVIRLTQDKPALALPVAAALYRTGAPDRMTGTPAVHADDQKLRTLLTDREDSSVLDSPDWLDAAHPL